MTERKLFVPHEYQKMIVDHTHDVDRCAVWAGMGLGKTSATLLSLDYLYDMGAETMPTLVLAPLRVAQSTWPDEILKWSNFRHMEVQPIVGTQRQRIVALNNQNASIFTINYECIPWLVEWFKHNKTPWPFGTIISDESTKLKGYRTKQGGFRARALAEVAHRKVHRFIELTGTPAPNGLKDLWGQAWFLDGGERLGRSYNAFQQRWFQSVPGSTGFSNIRPLPHAQEEIQDKLRDLCLTIRAEDYFDIDKPIVRDMYVQLPPKVMQQYRKMEKEMFAQIDEHDIEAFNAASRTMKCQQMASGAVYLPDGSWADGEDNWADCHDAKLQTLEDIVEEAAGMPVLVAYKFKSDAKRITRAFPKARLLDKNPQTLRDWNTGKIPILVAHPGSAGHGLNLQDGGNILVYFSLDWNMEEHDQILERIGPTRQKQSGHDRAVFVYRIVAKDTIDEDVLERLTSKREVQDILLDAMKRKAK